MTTNDVFLKLMSRLPSGISKTELAWVHSSRPSAGQTIRSTSGSRLFPTPPFPQGIAPDGHLDQVVAVDLALVL